MRVTGDQFLANAIDCFFEGKLVLFFSYPCIEYDVQQQVTEFFLNTFKIFPEIASASSYISSMVRVRRVWIVCLLSHGHFSLNSFMIFTRRRKDCANDSFDIYQS